MDQKATIAIRELKQQYDQCELHCMMNSGWKATTASLIKRYTGENSEFYEEYQSWKNVRSAWGYNDEVAVRQQARVKLLIAHTIQHIERNGIYNPPKKRIFEKLPDWQTILAIITIIGIVFSAGYKTGEVFEKKAETKEQIASEVELDSFRRGLKFSPVLSDSSSKKANKKSQTQNHKEIKQGAIHKNLNK